VSQRNTPGRKDKGKNESQWQAFPHAGQADPYLLCILIIPVAGQDTDSIQHDIRRTHADRQAFWLSDRPHDCAFPPFRLRIFTPGKRQWHVCSLRPRSQQWLACGGISPRFPFTNGRDFGPDIAPVRRWAM
jgi:hypothetical protein